MNLKDYIRSISDYPKKGILFRDITTLIKDENAFAETINQIVERSKKYNFTKIAAIESRGFVFASAVSYVLKKPFIMLRKKTNYQLMFILLILNLNMEQQPLKFIKTL
jgi:adenine phosphoribosyltransferase